MQENIEKQNKSNEESNNKSEKKKFTLAIDYSKFQQKFKSNNNNKENIKKDLNNNNNEKKEEKNILYNDEKIRNEPTNQKNFDQFLNISGILDESQSSFSPIDNKNNNKIESDKKLTNNININSNKIEKNFINNCFDDLQINNEKILKSLTNNYKDLIKNNVNENKRIVKFSVDNKKREKSYDSKNIKQFLTSTNTTKKKNKYTKFLNNKNNEENERKKNMDNFSNDKITYASRINKNEKNNSYVQMIKNGNNSKDKNSKNNTSFILFNGTNKKHNNSNFSDISYNALSTATMDANETFKKRTKTKNKINKKGNILYSNFSQRYNLKPYEEKNKKYDVDKNKKYNENSKINLRIHNENNSVNKNNNINSKISMPENYSKTKNNKNDDFINLLDNIKSKYKNQENKYINQQKNMKNEISILKEKLKELSVNEALYQVEIEKLKRNKNEKKNNEPNINNNDNITNEKEGLDSNEQYFGQKLDNIIQKYNKNPNNNLNSSSLNNNTTKNNQLLELFNIDKDMLDGEDIFDENDNINYEEVINKYPMLKKFIQILIKKYKNEKEYRMRLEEKTIEIFTNDIKRINYLEKKIKKYEADKHFKANSSLNYSYDNDLFEENITKNCYKSFDKSL